VEGTFVYTPSAGHILAPGRYTLSASFTPSDSERFAAAQATVMLEVEGASEPLSSSIVDIETPYTWTFTSINSAGADSARADENGERTANRTTPRETRIYKGSVYEKGMDGKWHIQKK